MKIVFLNQLLLKFVQRTIDYRAVVRYQAGRGIRVFVLMGILPAYLVFVHTKQARVMFLCAPQHAGIHQV